MPHRGLAATPGLALLTAAALAAPSWSQTSSTAPSTACWAEPDKKGAHGEARTNFQKPCVGGVMAPASSSYDTADARAAKALAAPSDADQAARSQTCAAAADDKGHDQSQRKSIRSDCMAADATPESAGGSAAPAASSPMPKAPDAGAAPSSP